MKIDDIKNFIQSANINFFLELIYRRLSFYIELMKVYKTQNHQITSHTIAYLSRIFVHLCSNLCKFSILTTSKIH